MKVEQLLEEEEEKKMKNFPNYESVESNIS